MRLIHNYQKLAQFGSHVSLSRISKIRIANGAAMEKWNPWALGHTCVMLQIQNEHNHSSVSAESISLDFWIRFRFWILRVVARMCFFTEWKTANEYSHCIDATPFINILIRMIFFAWQMTTSTNGQNFQWGLLGYGGPPTCALRRLSSVRITQLMKSDASEVLREEKTRCSRKSGLPHWRANGTGGFNILRGKKPATTST